MDKNEVLNSDCDVRVSVARNPNTPVDVLMELAKDSDIVVRRRVACNSNTPVDVLIELEKDSDWAVRRYAACNPKLKEVLTYKNKSDED